MSIAVPSGAEVEYPESDGMPMAENTLQYEWIVTIKGNLDVLFRDRPDVFVAGDNLIYPVRGNNTIRMAPDVYVAFGRPKGHRGSYKVWEENNIFPQVVFEVWSPGNRAGEMKRKRAFYRTYGAEEYYLIDPEDMTVEAWSRDGDTFREIPDTEGWVSPRLGIHFTTTPELAIFYPDGRRFLSFVEVGQQAEQARQEREQAQREAEQARQERDRLLALLRAAGIDPDQPPAG